MSLAVTIYADVNGGGDYLTIREGMEAANHGDVVLVAPGTYTGPDNRDLDFGRRNIVVRSEEGRQSTVIDCEHQGRAFSVCNGQDESTVIQGFTITHGMVETGGGGSAIYCCDASPTIIDCAFVSNAAYNGSGCGIECVRSSATITNCDFINNSLAGDSCSGSHLAWFTFRPP